ncbi:GNAT family N-acetyltransferase [Lederbergia sp. NSJ-179]|uniref:GNAT family N-acetyltransferase n=1 Tax=Lederbergia sp. NSJ-179 TaxID=2931402 RepID=UPI001FD5D7C5|nr:GNAT family N-acetyltransferase [Lederbergia sp. NSJ-179]MCJ7839768.1 GNAT family N-acetyltransferase [Lederbergia sp. NSJ-179]
MLDFLRLDEAHLEVLDEWFKDEEVLLRLGGILPLSNWFQYVQKSPYYWAWLVQEQGRPVGAIWMEKDIDFLTSIALLTHPQLRNQGYGTKMLQTLLKRPEISRAQKIEVGIEPDNLASLSCFRKAGFNETGFDKDGFRILTLEL